MTSKSDFGKANPTTSYKHVRDVKCLGLRTSSASEVFVLSLSIRFSVFQMLYIFPRSLSSVSIDLLSSTISLQCLY